MGGDAGDADFLEEVGGGASPGGLIFEKLGDGVEDRRGRGLVEGSDDGFRLIRESGSGPVGGVGVLWCRVEARGGVVGKSGARGIAEHGEDLGAKRFEFGPEIGFGATRGGSGWCEADGNGARGQRFVGIPAGGGGDDDWPVEFEWKGLAVVTFFAIEKSCAGGQTAQGVGKARANGADVIESENPIVLGDGEEFFDGVGKREEGSGRWVDQGAQHAGRS